jgi:hypothetical protein
MPFSLTEVCELNQRWIVLIQALTMTFFFFNGSVQVPFVNFLIPLGLLSYEVGGVVVGFVFSH